VVKAADEFKDKTTHQTNSAADFTYLKVIGWGWFYLSTVLDDFSRYIVAWEAVHHDEGRGPSPPRSKCAGCRGARQSQGPPSAKAAVRNGSSYISDDPAKWLERHDMAHVRGAPYHPMTQGKIERWHQTLKNRILLENYYLPGDLEAQIEAFVADYNHRRYHESIGNLPRPTSTSDAARQSCCREKDQTPDHRPTPLAAPTASRVTSSTKGARASPNWHCSLSQKR